MFVFVLGMVFLMFLVLRLMLLVVLALFVAVGTNSLQEAPMRFHATSTTILLLEGITSASGSLQR